ncbi:ATP-binding protein [Halanaerobaculum tunisiense]
MRELSLHILDIIQNSISAEASLIKLVISEDTSQDRLAIEITDNGCGLEATTNALDPFWTSRNTREVGLGLPLFQAAAERCGGDFNLKSTPQQGTKVEAIFQLSHIDRAPLGDIAGTVITCITSNPEVDFVYHHQVDETSFEFDTREIRAELGSEVALDNRQVVAWMEKYLTNNLNQLRG